MGVRDVYTPKCHVPPRNSRPYWGIVYPPWFLFIKAIISCRIALGGWVPLDSRDGSWEANLTLEYNLGYDFHYLLYRHVVIRWSLVTWMGVYSYYKCIFQSVCPDVYFHSSIYQSIAWCDRLFFILSRHSLKQLILAKTNISRLSKSCSKVPAGRGYGTVARKVYKVGKIVVVDIWI